jgi:hypothetical protein
MFTRSQVPILTIVALALWGAATLYIRLFPHALTDPLLGGLSFATTLFFAWGSVVLIRRAARLAPDQLLAGVALVGAIAMMIDGAMLHWLPAVYGDESEALRAGAAWLLWGYGVSLAIALLIAKAKAEHAKAERRD